MRLLEYFDDLTYEEMLALEEHMGKVTRGLTDEEMATLPVELVEDPDEATVEEERSCTICLENFRAGDKARRLRYAHVQLAEIRVSEEWACTEKIVCWYADVNTSSMCRASTVGCEKTSIAQCASVKSS